MGNVHVQQGCKPGVSVHEWRMDVDLTAACFRCPAWVLQCGVCWVPQCGDNGAVVMVPQAGHVPVACQELMCDTGGHWALRHVSWGGCEVEQHMGHRQ